MTIRIVTDSTADLDADTVARYGITVVPMTLHFGRESWRDGLDIRDALYARIRRSPKLPRTAQPPPAAFRAAYDGLADADGIVSIHIGGRLSGTIHSARAGADLRAPGSPPVEVVDTNQTSMALGNAVLDAAAAASTGADLSGVADAARDAARRCRLLLFVDTLEYLQKGGRIGRARALLGTLLRTKPLLELRNGEIEGIERPRTRQRAMQRLFEMVSRIPNPDRIAILYGSTPDDAATLRNRIQERLGHVPVILVQVSPVVGVHTGPGALGAAVLQAKR